MKPESKYKGRIKDYLKAMCKRAELNYWMTSMGFGAKAGIPDQFYCFGSVAVFFENKRKSKEATRQQEKRLTELKDMGFIAFCESAEPESMGPKGEERQKVIRQLLAQLQDNDVLARAEQYVDDCYQLKKQLERELL